MITDIEQQTMDIDWFLTGGEYIGFMASGGGKLPASVAESEEKRRILAHYFRNLPEISEVMINPELDSILDSGVDDRYLEDFVLMTKKGLYSFDKTDLIQFLDSRYHLVASPKHPLKLEDLPQNILEIVVKTNYSKKLVEIQGINISEID